MMSRRRKPGRLLPAYSKVDRVALKHLRSLRDESRKAVSMDTGVDDRVGSSPRAQG